MTALVALILLSQKDLNSRTPAALRKKRQTVVFFIEVLIALIEISRETVPLRRSAKMN
jgi:hypothetical protein